jgi:hypothetical protein
VKNWAFIICFTMLLKPVIPVFEYVANYNYISTVLCINKEAPAMHCNGKCHLMKELAKAAESEKPLSQEKKQTAAETTDLFIQDNYSFVPPVFYPVVKPVVNCPYTNKSYTSAIGSVFRPPIFIA